MTREEHLQWCKNRALEYVEQGNLENAFMSMASDLQKHDGTRGHVGIQLGMAEMMMGLLSTSEEMKEFINGFN